MSDFLPPVTAEFTANTTGFIKGITTAVDALTRLSTAARDAATIVTESFTAITEAAQVMGASTVEATAATKTQLQGIARALRSTGTAADKAAASTDKAMTGMATAVDAMAADVEGAAVRASTSLSEVGAAARTAAGETAAATRTTTTTATGAATGAASTLSKIGKAVSVLGLGVGVESIKMAADFQSGTNVLVTAAGELPQNLDKVRSGILQIATQTGTSWEQLTEGMYQSEKAGFSYAKGGLDVVRVAAQGAREEGAPLNDVVRAMTTIMNNYNIPASKSVQVMNALKTGAGMSTVTFAQFNTALATVLPIASSVGMSFDKVSGAISVMTQHGETARHSTQLLNNTIRNLAAPTKIAQDEMLTYGISSTKVSDQLGKKGVAGTLEYLSQTVLKQMGPAGASLRQSFDASTKAAQQADQAMAKMPANLQSLAKQYAANKISTTDWTKSLNSLSPLQKTQLQQWASLEKQSKGFTNAIKGSSPAAETYASAIKKMTGGANGLQATLELTGANYSKVTTNIGRDSKSLNDASKDVEGWGSTQKQLTVQLAQLKQGIETMAITIGTILIPPLSALLGYFQHHTTAAKALAAVIAAGLTVALAAFAAKGIGKTISALKDLGGAFLSAGSRASQFVKAVAGADLGESASGAAKAGAALRSGVGKVASGISSGASGIGRGVSAGADAASAAFDTLRLKSMYAWDAIKAGGSKIGDALKTAGSAAKTLSTRIGEAAKAGGQAAWTGLVSGAKNAGAAMKTAALAALDFSKKALLATGAAIKQAATFVIDKAATLAAAVAEKAMAIAEWALNVAMDANPLMLIVIAIAAVVAALIYAYNHFAWFRSMVNSAFKAISDAISFVIDFVKAHWQLVLILITGPIGLAVTGVMKYWKDISGAFSTAISAVTGFVKDHWQLIVGILTGPIGTAVTVIGRYWRDISSAFSSAWSAVKSSGASAVSWVGGLPGRILRALGNTGSLLWNAGASIINGLLHGLQSGFGKVKSELSSLTSQLPSWKGPPAKDRVLLHDAGQMIIEGLINGMGSRFSDVQTAAGGVGKATVAAFSAELGIASPSKVFRSLGAYVMTGLVDGLTGSTASVKAATKRIASTLYVDFGSSHKGLQEYVGKENSLLLKLASNRDSVASKLKSAQSKLTALQKSWTTERDSVASGIMQGASIVTTAPQDGMALTATDVVNNMKMQVQQAQQFAAELDTLRKKGLNSTEIAQIAAAGVDQGGATAQALASASTGTIKQLNSLQGSMQSAANNTGAAVADSMYGAGIKSAEGLVKGLQSQQNAIDKQMLKIAKSMKTAIEKALDIHSPSRVFAKIGEFVPLGVAQGVSTATHHATTAVQNMGAAMVGAGSFGVRGLAASSAGGASTVTNHVHVTVQGNVLTERQLVDVVQQGFLRLGMRNPQTWAGYKR